MKRPLDLIAYTFIAAFLLLSFFLMHDFAPNIDSQKNFMEGEINLTCLLRGPCPAYIYQTHGALFFMAAEISKRVLNDAFHWLDPVTARHLLLPFLSAFFFVCFYRFLRKHVSSWVGLGAITLLATYPVFIGNTYNNLKDVPLFIFMSLSIMGFAEWELTGQIRWLYAFFGMLGIAVCSKLYALLVLPILLIWKLALLLFYKEEEKKDAPGARTVLLHGLAGLACSLALIILFFSPLFMGQPDKLAFLKILFRENRDLITGGFPMKWRIFPLLHAVYQTPAVILGFAIAGILLIAFMIRENKLYTLFLLWLFIPLLLGCSPWILYYNGMRHFLVFLPPFMLCAAWAIVSISRFISARLRWKEAFISSGLLLLLLGNNLAANISVHPYQTVFFNTLAGGLQGAQKKQIGTCWDYWLNSYNEAGRWLDQRAAPNATVVTLYPSRTSSKFNTDLLLYSLTRKDLRVFRADWIPSNLRGASNTYFLFVPIKNPARIKAFFENKSIFRKVLRSGGRAGRS